MLVLANMHWVMRCCIYLSDSSTCGSMSNGVFLLWLGSRWLECFTMTTHLAKKSQLVAGLWFELKLRSNPSCCIFLLASPYILAQWLHLVNGVLQGEIGHGSFQPAGCAWLPSCINLVLLLVSQLPAC